MRVITHCPACQTQFFATEEQLNKHGGKVRCGQCMHVFDARAQLVRITEQTEEAPETVSASDISEAVTSTPPAAADLQTESVPGFTSDPVANTDSDIVAEVAAPAPSFLGDTGKKYKAHGGQSFAKPRRWLWRIAVLVMMLLAVMQSIYFMRNEIAIYYPQTKPYLLQACKILSCSINLPQKIDFIVIDDSDMQEDADHAGLVRFASTLINQGHHVVAYPNLELTLTDVEDAPVIRRVFKPAEYLPAGINIDEGIAAGAETRIKLAITTSDIPVSGYRVFVTY